MTEMDRPDLQALEKFLIPFGNRNEHIVITRDVAAMRSADEMLDGGAGDIWLAPNTILAFEAGKIVAAAMQDGMGEAEQLFGIFFLEGIQFCGKLEKRSQFLLGEGRQGGDGRLARQDDLRSAPAQKLHEYMEAVDSVAGDRGERPTDGKWSRQGNFLWDGREKTLFG